MSKNRKAVREKQRKEGYFDGRFWEKVEKKEQEELSEEEAIKLGLEEYRAQQEEDEEDEKTEEKTTYEEKPEFNPFQEKFG